MTQPASHASSPKRKTPLYDCHLAAGAKMVEFGDWMMPVQYSGILEEHRTVRTALGIFDVSHMGEILFTGPEAARAVQHLVTGDVARRADGDAFYTCTCRPHGGIVDDCIAYRLKQDRFLIIVNASNIAKDFAHFQEHAGSICQIDNISDDYGLIAVQGPKALGLIGELTGGVVPPRPFTVVLGQFPGIDGQLTIARTGYTGEDGVEVMAPVAQTARLWNLLLENGARHGLKPAGLGARDTLRLEAKLCLYGNDIDEEHTPHEAGLSWVVKGKGYVGEEALVRQKAEGVKRLLIGFKVDGRGIARHGYPILDDRGQAIGVVTSGTVAPTVGGAVGMGYVPVAMSRPGTKLMVDCRGKPAAIEVVKGAFYQRPQA